MLSAMLAIQAANKNKHFPLLDLPPELVEKVVATFGPADQAAKKAARATCTQLRSAVNIAVSSVKIGSDMEGQTLPASILPQIKSVTLNVSNGQHMGMWTAENLALLGVGGAHPECRVAIEADAAIIHLDKLRKVLAESGMLPRVHSLNQMCWGVQGLPAKFGRNVEVSAKLKLVRLECVDSLIHNTLEHDNLTALCFAPMLKKAWTRGLIQEINRSAASTLRNLTVNFRPFQEVDMEPLVALDLPHLEHLELRAQNENGFGPRQLEPLAEAKMPALKHLVVEMTGSSKVAHLGEFLRPLVGFPTLESIEIWVNDITSFAGLWGVGKGNIFLPNLGRLAIRVSPRSKHVEPCCFAANPVDKVVDAFAGLTLDRLELHDIGLPVGASASGIKQLALTNPCWEDLKIAMSPTFSPDLKVIRVCGQSARVMRTKVLGNMMETPTLEPGWRIGSPSTASAMHKVRSFVVLHDLEPSKAP